MWREIIKKLLTSFVICPSFMYWLYRSFKEELLPGFKKSIENNEKKCIAGYIINLILWGLLLIGFLFISVSLLLSVLGIISLPKFLNSK